MKCKHCGAEIMGGAGFCTNCGARAEMEQPVRSPDGIQLKGSLVRNSQKNYQEPQQETHQQRAIDPVEPTKYQEPPRYEDPLAHLLADPPLDPKQPEKPQNNMMKIILGVVLGLAIFAAGFYFLFHTYTPATCTDAPVCTICGKVEGSPLGHDWRDATCLKPSTCARCGETKGKVLGHSWQEATCTAPSTCARCGDTSGLALGHKWTDATLYKASTCKTCKATSGTSLAKELSDFDTGFLWSSSTKKLSGKGGSTLTTHPAELYSPIEDCVKLSLTVGVSDVTKGKATGEWGLWIYDENGKWTLLKKFKLSDDSVTVTYEFDKPISFSKFAVGCRENRSANYSITCKLFDVWVMR